MAANRRLRAANQLVGPAVEQTVKALNAPDSDAALVALARRQAATVDAMPDGVAVAMLPQHSGQLLKTLAELQARAAKRGQAADARPSRLDALRAARSGGASPTSSRDQPRIRDALRPSWRVLPSRHCVRGTLSRMAMTDDITRLTREVWRLNLASGFQSRMGWAPETHGKLAKAAGATPAQLSAWLAGQAQPTTGQALAVLDALPLPAVTALAEANGTAK